MQLCSVSGCWVDGRPGERCTAEFKLRHVLNSTFKHQQFLPGQLEALLPVAHGKDVFVHMRTGGGKSLCMFVLPLAFGGEAMGIIISPLVGLMEQQVSDLHASMWTIMCVVGVSSEGIWCISNIWT